MFFHLREKTAAWALAGAALMLAAPALSLGCGGASQANGSAGSGKLEAPGELQPPQPAPEIELLDSTGRLVHLTQFRGKAVMLTFIYDHCPDTCPLIVAKLHQALQELGPRASKLQIVAVSVDPKGDTPQTVNAFLALHHMTGRMEYLVGSLNALAPVWTAYDISAQGTPKSREVSHTALVYGITATGKRLALYDAEFKPSQVAHDVPLLAAK